MRLSAKVQGAARKTAAKSRASLAPVPPEIVVGCRVLVKAVEGEDPLPGLVLFIGETQFAAGTWLGVELDDPKGKNDGTVQGVSYFNARVNHGLFVRAVKVQKIEDKEATGRPTLPAPSSPAQKMPKAFAVGDRVLVRPAENSPGTVRFAGQTKFAEGEWFGVELEKPLGKNDGSVKGVSYFTCPAAHGIFARRDHLTRWDEPTAAALASPASLDVSTTAPVSPVSPASPVEATKASFSPLPDSRVKVMEAELEQLKKELQRYRDAQEVAAVVPTAEVPTRMTKRMKEDFENEIEHFLERRAPLWPSARSGCTGFGAFLREQKESAGLSFRDIAAAAAQQWRDLDEHAREVFREQQAALAGQKKKIKVAAPRAGAFASAVYGRPAALVDTGSDSEYEEEGLTGENEAEARPKAAKAVDLEILGGLIEDYWNSEGADDRTEPFFRFELDESVSKVERCLTGDLHLMSPENDRVGHLGAGVKRFDTVTMKGRDEPLVLLSFNPETLVCKVISDESSFKDPIDKEPSRVGYVTLANLKFQRRLQDREINFQLKESDFYPPEVGDLHRVARETSIVEKVWEDDLTGRFHWSYGVESTDHKAPSTCCTRKGRLVVPMKKLPEVAIREMITEETEKVLGKRKSPEGWCDIPKLWHTLDAGHNQLEVACVSAVVVALAEAAGKRRGGPRRALALDHATVPGKRPRVTVKCTDKAFMCKAGSRFGILKQNALGRDCIDRCGSTIDFFKKDCKYQVRIDNTQDEQEIDARLAKAIQLPQLEYAGGSLLTILLEDGRLVNAQVSRQVEWNRFAIKVDGQDQDQLVELNEANHVQGHCADFDSKAYLKYCAIQRDRFRFLEDSITCRKMDVETQVIYIDTAVESATVQTPDIKSLADLLLGADGERFKGQQLIYRCLMIAGPGTGKTWSSCQLMYHLSKACSARSVLTGIVKMPTLIFAQKIAGMMRAEGVSDVMYNKLPLAAQNAILDKPWLEDGFKIEYGQEYCAVLVRALRLRSAIVLLDGIDEASDVKGVLQSYIMRRLVPMEISLVLTSRPEGVSADLSTLKQSFAIMSLKPLSDKQQKDIILNQVQSEGNEFFEKMMGFADIRAKHDLIYYHEAFPDPKDRRYMEKQLPAVNRFKKEDGSWDPTMVQHLKGQVIKAIPTGTAPSSAYLKAASGYFTGELFRVMDKLLKEKKPTADLDAVLKEKFPGTDAFKPGPSLAKKLYELAEKKKVTNNQDLWSKVVCNTDQLLTAAEDFKPVFEKAVDALCKYVQEELKKTAQEGQQISYDYDLVLGPLKDPVRVCEKAADDYADRFPDFLAESNVVDVIRARLVCTSGSQMKTFLKKISESYETEIEGQKVKLSLARAKNKFSSKDSDPSRFRNVLLNLELSRDGQSHFVELQVHHKLILDFNDESHAHDYYDFFRRELANQYGKEMEASLNFMLEERMLLFKEISEVPVLLSVMTMALLHSNQMPSNLFELYDMGLQNILSSQLGDVTKEDIVEIWRLMQLVALNNQLNQKRIFMQKDVETALVEDKHLLPVWAKFVEKGEVPFVKILADGDDAEYQFRHLSFQEALASQALAEQNQLGLEAAERFKRVGGGFAEFLNIPFYRNMLRIGAGRVGDVFGRYWPLTSSLTDDGRAGLWNLLLGAKKLILASFLRPDASTYKSYEKAAFPPGSEDWFFTIFMFGKPKGNGSLMYNLSKIKSQVKNLQAALVTHEACHILFRNQGLDVSAFEVPSIAFPMSWDGHGQALDVSKAPPRIGLQLSFNWKNSLLHFEESEVVCLDPAQPKSQIPDRAPELHRLSGPRWIFVSETPQEPYNFNPCVCTKVIPVYMRGSHCSFLSSSPKLAATSVSGDVKRGQRTEKTGNILAHQAKVQPKTTFTTEWPPPPWRIAASEEVEGVMMSTYQFYHRAAAVEGATEGVESVKVSTRWLAATGGGGNDVMVSTYQSSYELKSSHALSDFVTVPPAGKQRVSEEKYRFHRTEEVIAAAGGHSVGSGFAGGHLEQHYGRVAQVARASRRRQMVATQFLCMRATFLTWRMARGMKDPDPPPEVTEAAASSVAMGESKNETAGDTPALPEVLAEKEGLDDLEAPVSKAKHYEDSGGNAEVFRPKDAEKGLAFLMNLWSRAWNDQGNRLSDFQRVLNEMALPELPPSAPQQLRRWSRRGVAWDFRLEPWPIMQMGIIAPVPKVKDPNDLEAARSEATAKSERIQKKVCSEWALALRGETTKEWSTEFSPWKMLADGVIRDDIILPDQAPAMRCERGHELKLMQTSGGNQCDRCNENDDNQGHNKIHFRCQPCDFDVCIYCAQRIKEAYWKAHAHHDWAAERRDQAMRCACRLSSSSATRVPEELEKPRCPPGRHIYKRTKPGDERCACGREEALYRCENRECQHAICRKCFLREGLRLRRPWDSDTVLEGWQLLPVDAVRLDHPTKKQIMIARRRQAKGKQWQDLFSLRHFRQALNVEFFTHRMEPEKAASFLTKHVDRFQSSSREVRVLEPNKALPPMRRPWPTCQRGHFLDQTQSSTKGRLCNVCGKFAGGYHCSRCQGYKVCRLCYVQMSDRCRAAQRINKENHNEDFLRCLAAKRRLWRTRPEEHVRTSLRGPMPTAFFTHRLEDSEVAACFLKKFQAILVPPSTSTPTATNTEKPKLPEGEQ